MQVFRRQIAFVSAIVLIPLLARAATPKSYLRFIQKPGGGGQLQSALVTFQDHKGRQVTLVAAVHIADAAYYQTLNRRFKSFDAVLFELVAPNGALPTPGDTDDNWLSGFQHGMGELLGLTFQLDQINYAAPNFVHADLDPEAFYKKMHQRGESLIGLMIKCMLANMDTDNPATQQMTTADLLTALFSPDRSRQLKLLLGQQFQDINSQMAVMEGTVLLAGRDKKAIAVLESQLKMGMKNLAIFYGAGHMSDLQKRVEKLGFMPVHTQWQTAWNIPPAPAATTRSAKTAKVHR